MQGIQRWTRYAAITGAICLASVGVARATVADGGVISACAQDQTGALRVVTAKETCRKSETAIGWNQQGREGPRGPVGPQGPAGSDGTADVVLVTERFEASAATNARHAIVRCPAGHVTATGGGYAIDPEDGGDLRVISSQPDPRPEAGHFSAQGWHVTVRNETGRPFNGRSITFFVTAVCARA